MKKLIVLLILLCGVYSYADLTAENQSNEGAVYLWTGQAGDGNWNTPGNWKVTGSKDGWKYPNNQDKTSYTNRDCVAITIANGDTVKVYSLGLDGKRDGTTTNVLTVDNHSTLKFGNALWIADHKGTNGTAIITGGSTLDVAKLIDIGNWSGLDRKAALNISDSTVKVGNFKGYSIRIGMATAGTMTVSGKSTVTTTGAMHISDGSADAKCIVNAGTIDISGIILFGEGGGSGKAYLYLNGGEVKAENLKFTLKNAKIVYVNGKLMVNAKNISKTYMKTLINIGRIDVSGAANGYKIINIDGYTALVPK